MGFQLSTSTWVKFFPGKSWLPSTATLPVRFGSRLNATLHMANPLRVKVGSAIIGPKGAHVQQLKEVLHGINGRGMVVGIYLGGWINGSPPLGGSDVWNLSHPASQKATKIAFCMGNLQSQGSTLPETNSEFTPENGWSEIFMECHQRFFHYCSDGPRWCLQRCFLKVSPTNGEKDGASFHEHLK